MRLTAAYHIQCLPAGLFGAYGCRRQPLRSAVSSGMNLLLRVLLHPTESRGTFGRDISQSHDSPLSGAHAETRETSFERWFGASRGAAVHSLLHCRLRQP